MMPAPVPLGITPQWVKDTGKEAVEGLEGIAAILRNPGRALASLGQQVTDTVEEKGIAYALSYVAADIVIGILVDKGIGKIRGMDKADDLAKLSTKVDDVVDVADDLEAGVKAVDKIDDVVDGVLKNRDIKTGSTSSTIENMTSISVKNVVEKTGMTLDEFS